MTRPRLHATFVVPPPLRPLYAPMRSSHPPTTHRVSPTITSAVIASVCSHTSCIVLAVGSSGFTPLNAGHDLAPRQRPAIVPGQVAEETIAIVPDAVRKLFANGWTSYVPLTYLTDEYCEKVDEHHKLEPVVRLDTSTGQWVRSGDQLPDRSEASMSFVKWTRAWQRLLGILESINHPDRDRWLAHTQIVMNRPTIEEEWPLWVRYCIAVRKRSLQDSFDPGVFQLGIYATVRRIYDRDRADASSLAYINAELARRTTTSTQPPPRAGPNQPFPTVSPSSRAPRQPGARARSNHSPSVCFVCGSREHLSITCSATSLASGKPLLVSRTSADAAWTLSGKSFCFKFNSSRGCAYKACTNAHTCSLCGSSSHGAQTCQP